MNIQSTDILLRKTDGTESLWVSQRLVMEVCGISEGHLRRMRTYYKQTGTRACDRTKAKEFMPKSDKAWRWAKTSGGFYYCLDNIPDRSPKFYRSMLGSAKDLKEALKAIESRSKSSLKQELASQMKQDMKSFIGSRDMHYYMYEASHLFAQAQAKELAAARGWCLYILSMLENDGYKKTGILRKQDFYTLCSEILSPMNLKGLNVSSGAYLRNKLAQFPVNASEKEQQEWFISDNYGNTYRQIIGKMHMYDEQTGETFDFDPHQALILSGYMNIGCSEKQYMNRIYEEYYLPGIAEFGLEPVAPRTFTAYLQKFDVRILTEKARHGLDYYKKHYLTYVTQEKLKYAHSLFSADGTGTITYKYWGKSDKGKRVLKSLRLYVMMVVDVASGYIAGYSFAPEKSHAETFDMLKEATGMAVINGGKQSMLEFVSDNHPAFTSAQSKDLLEFTYDKVRTIEVGNSQSNPTETHFRIFKKELKILKSFLQSSYNPSIEGMANMDHINTEDLPDYADAVLLMIDKINLWNTKTLKDGSSRAQRFENKNKNCQPLDSRVVRRITGHKTEKSARYLRGFLMLTKGTGANERLYKFEIPDYHGIGLEMISKSVNHVMDTKLTIYYDETGADLYSPGGYFVMNCPVVVGASQAEAESTVEGRRSQKHQIERKEKQVQDVETFEERVYNQSAAMGIKPYSVEMALGGSKESFNKSAEEAAEVTNKQSISAEALKRARAKRDFDPGKWE